MTPSRMTKRLTLFVVSGLLQARTIWMETTTTMMTKMMSRVGTSAIDAVKIFTPRTGWEGMSSESTRLWGHTRVLTATSSSRIRDRPRGTWRTCTKNRLRMDSGCGSVGRAVTSNSRGPQFESSHWQKIILNIDCQLYWKDENKEKEAGNGPFKKQANNQFLPIYR